MTALYPEIEPFERGYMSTADGHSVYRETCGDPGGKPVVVLHGGPGSGCGPWYRRLFDPARYRIILFDQRNCGRSTPHASEPTIDLSTNTTEHLVDDIDRIRRQLGIDRWLIFGGSWGSTLALAYAERHPRRASEIVLFGVTAGLRREFDLVFRGGLAAMFPEAWARLRASVLPAGGADAEVPAATHRLLFDTDPRVRKRAAHEWCLWESAIPDWPPTTGLAPRFRDPRYALAFARIVTHYVIHDGFLEDRTLLDGASRIADVPLVVIDGEHDPQTTTTATELHELLPGSRRIVVRDASHSGRNTNLVSALIAATDAFAA